MRSCWVDCHRYNRCAVRVQNRMHSLRCYHTLQFNKCWSQGSGVRTRLRTRSLQLRGQLGDAQPLAATLSGKMGQDWPPLLSIARALSLRRIKLSLRGIRCPFAGFDVPSRDSMSLRGIRCPFAGFDVPLRDSGVHSQDEIVPSASRDLAVPSRDSAPRKVQCQLRFCRASILSSDSSHLWRVACRARCRAMRR